VKNLRIAVAYYRTLTSQSSASLTAGYLTAHLRHSGLHVDIHQLEIVDAASDVGALIDAKPSLLFYKPNFQDIHRLTANLSALTTRFPAIRIGLFGPFAVLNSEMLLRHHQEVRGILLPNHEFLAAANASWWIGDTMVTALEGVISRGRHGISFKQADPTLVVTNAYRLLPARDIEKKEPIVIANLEASRGCVHACTFCHIPEFARTGGVPILRRSVEDVIKELRELYADGKRYFIFNDAILGGGGSADGVVWLRELADQLCAEPLEYYFMGYFTPDLLERHPALFEKLAEAGLVRVFVGLEAATTGELQRFKKPAAISRYTFLKSWLQDRYIVPHIGFMPFHPFAKPSELLSGIEFLYTHGEIHRFATIRERTRLVPGTELMRQAEEAGLTFCYETDTPNRYRFANLNTQSLYDRMNAAWDKIGVPVLERLEHLFVTGFFIENMVRRLQLTDQHFLQVSHAFHEAHTRHATEFFTMTKRLISSPVLQLHDRATFAILLQEVQQCWTALMDAATRNGLEVPVSWITTGDLRSEIARPASYDGRWSTTRSGRLDA